MALEIKAKLIKLLPIVTGEGKNGTWTKQEFLVETQETYPKKVMLSAWGDKADEIKKLKIGDEINICFNAESREYNERWYTELKIWKVEKLVNKETNTSESDTPPQKEKKAQTPKTEDETPF